MNLVMDPLRGRPIDVAALNRDAERYARAHPVIDMLRRRWREGKLDNKRYWMLCQMAKDGNLDGAIRGMREIG